MFNTDFIYTDRKTKAEYVWRKYRSILKGHILDVGADECHLKRHLGDDASYVGIGLGGSPDREIDLDKEKIPFDDNSFDCVLCTDVLEHLENIHAVFDELCRVSRRWVIVSLPSPWQDFFTMLKEGYYAEDRTMKFYNLPPEPTEDRHRWFFSTEEAEKFISYRAEKNGMNIVLMDVEGGGGEGLGLRGLLRRLAIRILFSNSVNLRNLYTGTLWAVLEKGV
jgi:hypothetical protein